MAKQKALEISDAQRAKWASITTDDVELLRLEKLRNIERNTGNMSTYLGIMVAVLILNIILTFFGVLF